MKYSVVIPAAGQGKRMKLNKNKQFLLLEDKPVIVHTLNTFQNDNWCEEIIIVANKDEIEQITQLTNIYKISKVSKVVFGGTERQHSVRNGLKALGGDKIVLVHDGARPFVKEEHIHRLVEETEKTEAAILAVPIKDTVKMSEGEYVSHTVDRSSLWSVQTPQAFRLQAILSAHEWAEKNNFLGTDDASLMEKLEKPVSIVTGDYFNIKLTTREDIVFASSILRVRRGELV
ncbi:2-C-methyl-D-erythritol 4-phosphate cytidylyltransferase [Anaerobacillus alkalilacustris]|uniref:2-C-methyl-D-erythritol 4-phosphate cytidylyltransferase n=1 Tax=Anaerobacillus alkalilacustris TaxID=393763 RepID=A0A1S2M056_9BACI|nr:2-C-methyl-D-erythritol 4-phosphate cytidylyltransferase [Anaerobacillus alkalilacustris]OIJ17115.1 2-C-methyl-D-erythritol 4-phosphate cytidylyltransferase [Anaerobacillus alkalilacustris]